jgi:hypothetical protein
LQELRVSITGDRPGRFGQVATISGHREIQEESWKDQALPPCEATP